MENLVSCPPEVSYFLKTVDRSSMFDKENMFNKENNFRG